MVAKAEYRKMNDRSCSSSTYHKKDGTAVRAKLKTQLLKEEIMAEYPNHEAFFEANHDMSIALHSWGIERTITVEELYQHFTARTLAELEAELLKGDQEDSDVG